jgi:hypothetical protein
MKVAGARFTVWVIVLAVVPLLAACAGSSSSGSLNHGGGGPDEIAITCSGPLATPGVAPTPVAGSCAQSLGVQVAHFNCAKAADGGNSTEFRFGEINTHTASTTDQQVTMSSQSAGCVVTVPAGYVGALQSIKPLQDGDGLAVVDFVPRSGENSVGLRLRCPKVGGTPCIALFMYSNQTYQCVEVIDGKARALAHGTFAGQQFPAPKLEVNQPNRLVLSVKGDAVSGYINGRQICDGKTGVPLTLSPATLQIAQAGGTAPAAVDIIDFYVFAPA